MSPSFDSRFSSLGLPARIWAVSAINAGTERLMALHDSLFSKLKTGDRLVYLGNYMGGPAAAATVDELLTFRREFLALPGVKPEDIIYLRGRHEEMWHKLLQIQFAPDPLSVMRWILEKNCLGAALTSYNLDPVDALAAAQDGVMAVTRWTARLRNTVRRRGGHEVFMSHWRRAAYTNTNGPSPLLFVHAGINPGRPLHEQGDNFWWAGRGFNDIAGRYGPFHKVIRGYDPEQNGIRVNCVTASLDGSDDTLICAGFTGEGDVFDSVEIHA